MRPPSRAGAAPASSGSHYVQAPLAGPGGLAPGEVVGDLRRLRHQGVADLALAVVHDDLRGVAGVATGPRLRLLVLVELGERLVGALGDDGPAAETGSDVDRLGHGVPLPPTRASDAPTRQATTPRRDGHDAAMSPTMQMARVPERNGQFELVDVEIPEPGSGQVRIKVHACGVCHSDSLTVMGAMGNDFPRAPGHEVAGEVDAVGDGVSAWQAGDRVGVGWFGGCDFTCEACRRGDFISCA